MNYEADLSSMCLVFDYLHYFCVDSVGSSSAGSTVPFYPPPSCEDFGFVIKNHSVIFCTQILKRLKKGRLACCGLKGTTAAPHHW